MIWLAQLLLAQAPPEVVDPMQAWVTHLLQGGGVLGWLAGGFLALDRLGFIKRKSDGGDPGAQQALVEALQALVANTAQIGKSLERLLDRSDSAHDLLVALHAGQTAGNNGSHREG